jgi:Homeodomain-like domain-containing protein
VHSRDVVQEALDLGATGLNATEISRRLRINRRTVSDWLRGYVPASGGHGPGACVACGGFHDVAAVSATYVYLLGLYLGDGHISAFPRGVFRLRLTLDTKYPEIIDCAARAVGEVSAREASVFPRSRESCVDVSAYWKGWPCVFPQHGPGLKHDRAIVLANWQEQLVDRHPDQLLRGLIHSDGCRFINTGRDGWVCPRYAFYQASADIRRIFCEACDRLGLRWTTAGERTIYVSCKADVALLDTFIGPKR